MNEFQRPMQPWPALAAYGRRVTLPDGLTLFVYDTGPAEKPPALLIHGLGDEADTWRHVVAPLAERFRVVAVDLPGFGRSDRPRRAYTLPFLRDALLGSLDALALEAVTLIGSSLGAALAQLMALERPARVARLVLVDGTLTARAQSLNWTILKWALPIFGTRAYNGLRGRPQAAFDSLRPYYAQFDALPEADRQFLYQRVNERVWSDGQRDAYLSLVSYLVWSAPRGQAALEAQLARLQTPTHLVWGERDVISSVEGARALVALQPGAQLTILPGAGHLPHQERPAEFLQALPV